MFIAKKEFRENLSGRLGNLASRENAAASARSGRTATCQACAFFLDALESFVSEKFKRKVVFAPHLKMRGLVVAPYKKHEEPNLFVTGVYPE